MDDFKPEANIGPVILYEKPLCKIVRKLALSFQLINFDGGCNSGAEEYSA